MALSQIPFYSGWLERGQQHSREDLEKVKQAGGLMAILDQIQKQQKERAFRSGLRPDMTPEQRLAHAAQYAGADTVMRTDTSHLDRQAQIASAKANADAQREAARVNAEAQREATLAQINARGEEAIARVREQERERRITKEEADKREGVLKEQYARLVASLRPAPPEQPLESVIGPDGKPVFVRRAEAVGKTPAPTGAAAQPPKPSPIEMAQYNSGLKEVQKDEQDMRLVNQLETALKRWSELNANVATGRVVGLRPAVSQPAFQELVQLQSYLAVNNFKPGQGQISNFERQLIKSAGPTVNNDQETNDNIVRVQLGAVQTARERAEFREAYLESKKKLLGADKAWNEYVEKNPRYVKDDNGNIVANEKRKPWEQYFAPLLQSASPSSVPASTVPAGVDPRVWAVMTPEERSLWVK